MHKTPIYNYPISPRPRGCHLNSGAQLNYVFAFQRSFKEQFGVYSTKFFPESEATVIHVSRVNLICVTSKPDLRTRALSICHVHLLCRTFCSLLVHSLDWTISEHEVVFTCVYWPQRDGTSPLSKSPARGLDINSCPVDISTTRDVPPLQTHHDSLSLASSPSKSATGLKVHLTQKYIFHKINLRTSLKRIAPFLIQMLTHLQAVKVTKFVHHLSHGRMNE